MGKPEQAPAPPERVALYDRLVASFPGVERKGAANPYTAINGNMSSRLDPAGFVALRLPPGDRKAFLAKYATTLVEAYGIVQKEYVKVPDSLFQNLDEMRPYFEKSLAYASSLKPKPTTKPKKP